MHLVIDKTTDDIGSEAVKLAPEHRVLEVVGFRTLSVARGPETRIQLHFWNDEFIPAVEHPVLGWNDPNRFDFALARNLVMSIKLTPDVAQQLAETLLQMVSALSHEVRLNYGIEGVSETTEK